MLNDCGRLENIKHHAATKNRSRTTSLEDTMKTFRTTMPSGDQSATAPHPHLSLMAVMQ